MRSKEKKSEDAVVSGWSPKQRALPNGQAYQWSAVRDSLVFEIRCNCSLNYIMDRFKFFWGKLVNGLTFNMSLTELNLLATNCNWWWRDFLMLSQFFLEFKMQDWRSICFDLAKYVKSCWAESIDRAEELESRHTNLSNCSTEGKNSDDLTYANIVPNSVNDRKKNG